MIDPKELRIGNKVKCTISNDHGIYEILAIPMWEGNPMSKEPYILIDRCPQQLVPPSTLKAIRLTPEILQKCGFEYDKMCYSKGSLLLAQGDFGFDVWTNGLHSGITTQTVFLHHLQNLYWCLVGEELSISL